MSRENFKSDFKLSNDFNNKVDELNKDKSNNHISFSERAALGTFEASMRKANKKTFITFCEGILGGFFISLAYITAILVVKDVNQAGIKLLLMALVFPIAIMLITFIGGCLFTSNCIGFLNLVLKNIKSKNFIKSLIVAYCGNCVGTFIAALITLLIGLVIPLYGDQTIDHNYFASEASSIFIKKIWTIGEYLQTGKTINAKMFFFVFFSNLFSAIICNILIASTLYFTYATKNAAAISIMFIFDILAFVIGGFQHSVANSYLFWLNIFQGSMPSFKPFLLSDGNYTNINPLTIAYFFSANLIPSIIGNFIGGGVFLPGMVYFIHKDKIKEFSKELLEREKNKLTLKEKSILLIDDVKDKLSL